MAGMPEMQEHFSAMLCLHTKKLIGPRTDVDQGPALIDQAPATIRRARAVIGRAPAVIDQARGVIDQARTVDG
jgi:hypothetical protein